MEWCEKGVLTEVSLSDKPSEIFEDAECRDVFKQMVLGIEYRTFQALVFFVNAVLNKHTFGKPCRPWFLTRISLERSFFLFLSLTSPH